MTKTRDLTRTVVALLGAIALLATVVLVAGTTRPTEAQWTDDVYGTSTFSAGEHPDEDRTFARYSALYGEVIRVAGNSSRLGPGPTTVSPSSPVTRMADNGWTGQDAGTFFRAEGDHFNCARRDNTPLDSCAHTGHEDPEAKSFAVAQMRDFRSRIMVLVLPFRLVTLGQDQPTVATASCTPGETGVATLSGGQLALGSALTPQRFDLPGPGEYVDLNRSILGYDYEGYLHHDYEVGQNYARSQLRLYLQATGDLTDLDPWTVHVVLAHAECGTRMEPTPPPTRPGLFDPRPASFSRMASQPAGNTQPTVEAERSSDASSPTGVGAPGGSTPPPQPDADEEGTTSDTRRLEDVRSSAPTTTAATRAPTTPSEVSAPPATRSSTPSSTTPSSEAVSTPDEPPEPSVEPDRPNGPTQPENVRIGQGFAVVNRDGVELGTARIEDIQRLGGCGIEMAVSLTISEVEGPDRWSSIGPSDFAGVSADGAIREAEPVSAGCDTAADTATTALSRGRSYELLLAIAIDDSARQVMLRPAGTAGWVVDLPHLSEVPVPDDA